MPYHSSPQAINKQFGNQTNLNQINYPFMKIGALLPHTRLYGGVKRFIELGRVFQQLQHDFTIYTPTGEPPNWTQNDLRYAKFSDLNTEHNDMLFTTDRKNKANILNAKAAYKIFYHVGLRHKARIMVRDSRFHVFACSTNVYRHDRLWFQRTPFLAVGGINYDLFYQKKITERSKDDPFVIMLYGRLSEGVKGTDLIVRACEKLYKKYPFIRLLLFDTPVNQTMLDLDNSFTTSIPFEFVMNHPVDKNVELFHRADIFVSAEKQTGWANTVAEAMASGIPVVATRGGTLDMLVDNETGLLVKRKIRCIANGIEQLILSDDLRRKLAARGRSHIQQFDWKNLAVKILDWYERQEQQRTIKI